MKTETGKFGKYLTITIIQRFDIASDYEGLKLLFEKNLEEGVRHFAVVFSKGDHVSSSIISVLIHFYKQVAEKSGDLCLVAENPVIREIFDQLKLSRIMKVYSDLNQVPS